jgi:putative transcriptional regulator
MKCSECGATITRVRENYSYAASGLPHVTLVGIEVRRCKGCGEHDAVLPKIEQLHKVIALALIGKHARLTGAEVRYLRKYFGWSGAAFARHIGVTPASVFRWENARKEMGAVADRLLRLMVVTKAAVDGYPLDLLAEIGEKSVPVRLRVELAKGGWRAEGIAE